MRGCVHFILQFEVTEWPGGGFFFSEIIGLLICSGVETWRSRIILPRPQQNNTAGPILIICCIVAFGPINQKEGQFFLPIASARRLLDTFSKWSRFLLFNWTEMGSCEQKAELFRQRPYPQQFAEET